MYLQSLLTEYFLAVLTKYTGQPYDGEKILLFFSFIALTLYTNKQYKFNCYQF